LKLKLLLLEVLVDRPWPWLRQVLARFRYISVILGTSHYLGVTAIFVFCGQK
jgi:hypothetical protein